MGIKYYEQLEQGSDEWLQARCGLITASEVKHIVSRKTDRKTGETTYEPPTTDKAVAHLYELAAQRITQYVEPSYITDDMLRGQEDEHYARQYYSDNFGDVKEVGFITNDKWGFTIGYSPDGLVGDDGLIECKSRRQKFQLEVILDGQVPEEHYLQCQTGLLVSERAWIDYISYCGGMPMYPIRVHPDQIVQTAIIVACTQAEDKINSMMNNYYDKLFNPELRLVETKRRIKYDDEIVI